MATKRIHFEAPPGPASPYSPIRARAVTGLAPVEPGGYSGKSRDPGGGGVVSSGPALTNSKAILHPRVPRPTRGKSGPASGREIRGAEPA